VQQLAAALVRRELARTMQGSVIPASKLASKKAAASKLPHSKARLGRPDKVKEPYFSAISGVECKGSW
jgi:hypothetical protein